MNYHYSRYLTKIWRDHDIEQRKKNWQEREKKWYKGWGYGGKGGGSTCNMTEYISRSWSAKLQMPIHTRGFGRVDAFSPILLIRVWELFSRYSSSLAREHWTEKRLRACLSPLFFLLYLFFNFIK